jgi:hypothetical protein
MELFPNVLTGIIWIIAIILSLTGIVVVIVEWKKRAIRKKILLIAILIIPIADLSFGLSNHIRDSFRGEIVFSAIDDSIATTEGISIRQKNDKLIGYYEFSIAGFGDKEKVQVTIVQDTILTYFMLDRKFGDTLVFIKQTNTVNSINSNKTYRILINELLK